MSNLIIVESPTKAKTLSKFLGSDYRIEATMGHVRDLPKSKLGIEIKPRTGNLEPRTKLYEFIPRYQIISDRRQRVSELKKLSENASFVILATDPDREGEAIAWHVIEILAESGKRKAESKKGEINNNSSRFTLNAFPFKRIVFHEITETAIKQALLNPREIDMPLVDAQQARRILDRLVGYKLSPLLWNKLGKNWLSAGRVQSVAVRLIVEREREIEAFKPQEYWVIDVELQKINGVIANHAKRDDNLIFLARLEKINDKKAELSSKESADSVVENLKGADYKVSNIEIKDLKRYPAPPFTTSTLQQTASNRFGWSAKRTMRTAQSLYEEGLITYHRTDSTNLSVEAISMVRGYINNVYGEKYLPHLPKFYKTKSKVAQEAHEAIRPTDVKSQISNLKSQSEMGRDASILYDLIWKRFVACQMNEAVAEQTNVEVLARHIVQVSQLAETSPIRHSGGDGDPSPAQRDQDDIVYLLKSQGERMKFDGWITLYGADKDKELPPLITGDELKFLKIIPTQKFTEPPARFNEASLIKTLEEKGIGRPSTYAPIISTIQDRKYVEKIERRFKPTDLGFAVNDFLVKYFPDVFDIGFTAKMEDDLDEIANGKMEWENVVGEFYVPFKAKIDEVFKEGERVKVALGTTDEKCPKCGANLVYRLSKYGKFLACGSYPKCKFTKNVVEKVGIPCPRCGGEIVVKRTRRGKQFYGCVNYPKCTFAAWKKEDIK